MKSVSFINFIRNSVEDDYTLNVFYNIVKDSFVKNGFSLSNVSSVYIDGRFFGEVTNVSLQAKGNKTPKHVLALLLSIRLLMLNPKLVKFCNDDNLIITSRIEESFRWVEFMAFILDNWEDEEIKMLYSMLENYHFDEEFTEEEKKEFQKSIVIPEYRNEKAYYKTLAKSTSTVTNSVIGDCAFLEAGIDKYVVTKDIEYVGDTAFSYCEKLETLVFEGKVLFGLFPIIECLRLCQIIVPKELIDYYKKELPYYKNIITDEGKTIKKSEKEPVKHVSLDMTSDDSIQKTDIVDITIQKKPAKTTKQIDTKTLDKIFDKKATSYKYFWFLAIISLAKEKNSLKVAYEDILVRMAALAWPIIFDSEIALGKPDMLPKYLVDITKKTTLIKNASSNIVENYLRQHFTSQGIDKILDPLLKNVPYRFLSPWIPFTTNEEVIQKSNSIEFACPYALGSKGVLFDEDWWDYIMEHYSDIIKFTEDSFIAYVKQFNDGLKLLKFQTSGFNLIDKK